MDKHLNEERATNPKPGDYWQEMLVGVCIVLEVTDQFVIICRKKIYHDHGWVWDLNTVFKTTKERFKKWLSYDDIKGYWASVVVDPVDQRYVAHYREIKNGVTVEDDTMFYQTELDVYI